MTHDEETVERVARAILSCVTPDDEGDMPPVSELLGFSGENKTRMVGLAAARAALSALPARDDALEALRELLDEHDKAHGETKYTPAKQPPYSMTMDGLHRQTFAAMYAYVRTKLAAPAQEPRS